VVATAAVRAVEHLSQETLALGLSSSHYAHLARVKNPAEQLRLASAGLTAEDLRKEVSRLLGGREDAAKKPLPDTIEVDGFTIVVQRKPTDAKIEDLLKALKTYGG
jgi:hypothetical protein